MAQGTGSGQFNNKTWWKPSGSGGVMGFSFGTSDSSPWQWGGSGAGITAANARPHLWWE